MKTSVKHRVVYRHSEKYSIREMGEFFGVSRSGYYCWTKRMDREEKDTELAETIRSCQEEAYSTYGYRRVHIWQEK